MTRRKNRKIAVKKNCNVRKNLTANRKYKDCLLYTSYPQLWKNEIFHKVKDDAWGENRDGS